MDDARFIPKTSVKNDWLKSNDNQNHFLHCFNVFSGSWCARATRTSSKKCALVIASSGIAAALLDGGRTEHHSRKYGWLCERALLTSKNIDVNTTNSNIPNKIDYNQKTYRSIDTVSNIEDVVNYPIKFLNSLDHAFQLKNGVPIILLRNIHPLRLCNNTRLTVKKMKNNFIEATIIIGKFNGTDILLPRISLTTSEMFSIPSAYNLRFAYICNDD